MTFGDYVKEKRQNKGFTLRGFADALDIAPSYMSDIEKGKRNAPTQEILEKMIKILELSEIEKNEMIDLAATNKNTIAHDLTSYLSENDSVRVALRKARDLNLGDKEWMKIIEEIEKQKK